VGIDGDDRAETVPLRDRGQADRGFALEAPDLQDRPLRGRARGDEREKPRFTLGEETGGSADPSPRFVDGLVQIRRLTADG